MNDESVRLRKVAIVVASLDTAMADRLLDTFSPEQQRRIRVQMVELDELDPREERRVLEEFLGRDQPPAPAPPPRAVQRPPQPAPGAASAEGGIPFRFLQQARGEKLGPLLAQEHPQTIAVVLSHLPDEQAVEVLSGLASHVQAEVISRLIDLDEAHPEMLREVERGLQSRMVEHVRDEFRRQQGVSSVSRMLASVAPTLRRRVLDNLARHDPGLARELNPPAAHEWDDLGRLSIQGWGELMELVDPETARLALMGADPAWSERALRALPSGERAAWRQALSQPGALRLSDIEEAQQALLAAAQPVLDTLLSAAA